MSEKATAELGAAEKTSTVETAKPKGPIDGIELEQLMLEHFKAEEGEKPAPEKQAEEPPPEDPVSAGESEDGKVDLSQDEAETETTEEVEGEPETTEEEAETAETDEQDADLSDRAQKRINQLVRQKKEAQEESEELRAQLKEKPNAAEPILVSNALNPFFKLQSQSEVEAEIKRQRGIREFCEMNPDGSDKLTDEDGREIELSAEDIRRHKVNAMNALEQHLPDQKKYVRESREWKAETEKVFPFWKDRSSAAYQEAREFLEKVPELQRMPSYQYLIGATMLGLAQLNKDAKAGQKPKKAPIKKAPAEPKASPSPAPVSKETASQQGAYDRFAKSGGASEKDLTAYMKTLM